VRQKIIYPLLLVIFTFVLLFSTIYAWITLQEQANVGNFQISVEDYRLIVTFEVSRNGEPYHPVESINVFDLAVPSDTFAFRMVVENQGNTKANVFVRIPKIQSNAQDENYNLLDVFYLEEGKIIVDTEEHILDQEDYRLSNLIDESEGLSILENKELNPGAQTVITFVIKYDEETSDLGYQNGSIIIKEIKIYSQ